MENTQFKVKELIGMSDAQKKPCPKDLPILLTKVGITTFRCRADKLNWDTIRADAKLLGQRVGIKLEE